MPGSVPIHWGKFVRLPLGLCKGQVPGSTSQECGSALLEAALCSSLLWEGCPGRICTQLLEVSLREQFLPLAGRAGGIACWVLRLLALTSVALSPQWEFVFSFRQAQAPQNASPHVSAGMRVRFTEGTDTIEDLSIAYGGVGTTTVMAPQACQRLLGR